MGGHLVPEIRCRICNNPVDLTVDLSADENGKSVHEHCYVLRITKEALCPPTLVGCHAVRSAGIP